MRWQFSSIFPYLFFISLFLLPLSRPPYHAFNFILVCVLGLFFVNARAWIHLGSVRKTAQGVLVVSVVIIVSQLFSLGRVDSSLPLIFFVLGVLSLIPFVCTIQVVGRTIVSITLIGMILLWTQWGVAQFVAQRDLGFNLAGESNVSAEIDGVAKFSIENQKFMRAYGPFLHANTFGGVTLLGILIVLFWLMGEQQAPSLRHKQFAAVALFVLYLGLFLSFSRAAILGGLGILAVMMITSRARYHYVPLVCFLVTILFLPLLFFRASDPEDVALPERSQGIIWWSEIISRQKWWQGVGIGGYPISLENYLKSPDTKFAEWQVAPVHSVPLLFLSEFGILGSLLVILSASFFLWHRGRFQSLAFWIALTALLPALLFDHYFFTQAAPMSLLLMVIVLSPHSARRRRQ